MPDEHPLDCFCDRCVQEALAEDNGTEPICQECSDVIGTATHCLFRRRAKLEFRETTERIQ
jgi:hypothetical protein